MPYRDACYTRSGATPAYRLDGRSGDGLFGHFVMTFASDTVVTIGAQRPRICQGNISLYDVIRVSRYV